MRIVHEPFGDGNPYAQGPEERFPRQPRAGEPVGIGIVAAEGGTESVPAAPPRTLGESAPAGIRAWVSWSGGDGREHTAEAAFLHPTPEGWAFRAALPGFPEGERVTYGAHAEAAGRAWSAGPFSFSVPARHRVTGVISCAAAADRLTVEAATTWQGRALRMRFSEGPRGSLVMEREVVGSGPQGGASPATGTTEAAGAAKEHGAGVSGGPVAAVECAADRPVGRFGVSFHEGLLCITASGRVLLREAAPFSFLVDDAGAVVGAAQAFESPSDEGFYGFGERFDCLDQRGRIIDNRVIDNYCRQGMKTYIPVPFFLSSRGYGHFVETRGPVTHRMDSGARGRWEYEAGVQGRIPPTHVLAGKPREVVSGFSALTGPAAVPPDWAFGPWMSGNEWNSQARVMEVADRTRELGIPASVLVIEAWSDEATFSIWNDARYEARDPAAPFRLADFSFPPEGLWPDPKAMIDELHARGIKVVLWQIPVIKKCHEPHVQHDLDAARVRERGWCVRSADGSPYVVRPPWFRNAMVLDFTNPEAVKCWFDRRRYLVREMGVDGFKTDGGEHLWGPGLRFADGTSGQDAWNGFVNGYLAAYRRFLQEEKGDQGITFSRAGYTGAQRFPMHWNGDQDSSWESHRSTFFATLNAGLSGIPFMGWDIGGFAGPVPSAELYLRSAAMALFSPLMQYHADFNSHRTPHIDRSPWHIAETSGDASVVDIYRRFARARVAMLPYITTEARHCGETGEPMMRPLFLDWPEDPAAWRCADQYMFGRSLLAAPVLDPGVGSRDVYLPEGEWECLWTGERLGGGRTTRRPAPPSMIPAFLRAGAEFPKAAVREALTG